MKILIVDDNEIDIVLAKRALGSSLENNYEIKGTDCVTKALALIDVEVFDIILLDYHMPEINGIDAGAQDFIPKSDISHIKLSQAILHSKKRFDMEQKMQENFLALKNMAETDQLTGLHNRYYFDETLNFMIANSERLKLSVGMLILDLDDFKHINDSLGHHAGDILLIDLVARVKKCLRINDGFARLGGDEFAITLANINSAEAVNMIATRILQSFQQPFLIDSQRMDCTVSIGAALYPDNANSHDQLMKYADIAMYRAKRNGKNTLCFYESHYQNEFNRRFLIRNEMNEIIKKSSFRLFYQPIFCADSDNIKGVEALIRWPDTPKPYTPDEFIPIAEETRLIHDLGQWVIETALAKLSSWQKKFDNDFTIAINISAIQLQNTQLTNKIKAVAQQYSIKPSTIILEITETALLEDDKITKQTLNALSSEGFRIALDDFGMGFSSISHLNNYPIDIVKLDKTLQRNELNSNKNKSLLEAVTLMLKLLNFTVIAEGIETECQLSVCRGLKIDKFQGYLLGMPIPANLLEEKLYKQG